MHLSASRLRKACFVSGAVAAFVAGCASGPPPSYQPHMQNALALLQSAHSELEQAEPNKGGHRERALELVARAISDVQQGMQWAAQHGG